MSIIENVFSFLGIKDAEPTAAEVRDEDQRDVEAEIASAQKERDRAATHHAKESARFDDDEHAAEDAAKKLDELAYNRASDEEIDEATKDRDRANLRREASRRRMDEAAEVLARIADVIANLEGARAGIESERARAKLLEEASIEHLRKANAADEDFVLEYFPKLVEALARIGQRYDDANAAAECAHVPRLDSMHVVGGLVKKLAAKDPRYASHFLRDTRAARSAVKFGGPGPTSLPISNFERLLQTPIATADDYACDDLAVMLNERMLLAGEDALSAVRNERKQAAENSPEARAARSAWALEYRRSQERLRGSEYTPKEAPPADETTVHAR